MRSYKAVCKGRKTSANHISFAAVGSHQMTHNSGNIIKDTHTPTNTNARTHCFFFFSLKGKYLHRQKHTRATRKWMCNACVAKGPRGFSYWYHFCWIWRVSEVGPPAHVSKTFKWMCCRDCHNITWLTCYLLTVRGRQAKRAPGTKCLTVSHYHKWCKGCSPQMWA